MTEAILEAPPVRSKCNLLLHCGAHAVSRNELNEVNTPRATRTWQPIPHNAYLARVEEHLPRYGLRVVQQAHAITHDGSRYFGLLQVVNGCNSPDYSWVLGLRNSHDQSLPAGLVAGNQVFVCDNLAFSGEIKVARKHTRYIMRDLPELIDGAIGGLVNRWHDQDRRIEVYRGSRINDRNAHDLTIRALDQGVICGSRIPKVLKEWRDPSHEAFRPRNAWSLFNAFTETLKGNLALLPARTQRLYGLLDHAVGLN